MEKLRIWARSVIVAGYEAVFGFGQAPTIEGLRAVAHEKMIDNLTLPETNIVITRELLRYLGLSDDSEIEFSFENPFRSTFSDIRLPVFRSLITILTHTDDDAHFLALTNLQRHIEKTTNDSRNQRSGNATSLVFLNLIQSLHLVNCAGGYSNSRDSAEYFRETVDNLYSLGNQHTAKFLRYSHENLIIDVPTADQAMGIPLWASDEAEPDDKKWDFDWGPNQSEIALLKTLNRDHTSWSFWRDWYQGFLDGKPLDWELQRRVALIPDEDWEKGPEHIAPLIAEIREPFILRERIDALEKLLPARAVSRHGIGGNSPPESLDDIDSPQKAVTIVWAALDDLKAEIESEDPKPEAIKNAISWLKAVILACAKWSGGHLDAGIREGAKTAGKAAGAAGVAYIALIQPEVQATITKVVESATKWFGYLN